MLFAIICNDKPNSLDIRKAARPEHLAYLKTYEHYIQLVGPMMDDDGNSCGSLLIVDVDDRAAAEGLAAADPYAKVGLFESVVIRPFKKVGYEGRLLES